MFVVLLSIGEGPGVGNKQPLFFNVNIGLYKINDLEKTFKSKEDKE
jgi:hypothetical protein